MGNIQEYTIKLDIPIFAMKNNCFQWNWNENLAKIIGVIERNSQENPYFVNGWQNCIDLNEHDYEDGSKNLH